MSILLAVPSVNAQVNPDQRIDEAVRSLRNIKIEGLGQAQQESKAKQIDDAWKLLIDAGVKGSARLKKEIETIEIRKEQDDFFKLNATAVLWAIGKADNAEYISAIWLSTPVSTQYNYVFYTAFEAAQTQDPRVLPMLKAILKDNTGSIFVGAHAMRVAWPLSHEFVWGAYGSKGMEVLSATLESSSDPTELRSAMTLLSKAQHLPSLPKLRVLARDKRDDVRQTAITCLGRFGHPDDYAFLIAGLDSVNSGELFAYAFALYEFDDDRAVANLIPLLKNTNEQVKLEAALALLHLLTPESLAAVKSETAKVTNAELRKFMERSITLRQDKLPTDYAKKSIEEQIKILGKIRDDKLFDTPTDRKATYQQFRDATDEWKKKGRIYDSGFEWVGIKQMIETATADDIPRLLDTKASLYPRLSDECLYETSDIDTVIKYLGRSRYRTGAGVTKGSQRK